MGIWMYFSIKFFTWWGSEPVIKYTIAVPNPPGDGTVLENPSIKVGILHPRSLYHILTNNRLLARQLFSATLQLLANFSGS